jgi:PST family polysaccharide transporter
MFLPIGRVIYPIQETLSPAFARWQDDLDHIADVWLRALRLIATGLVPAMLGFAVVAPEFVNVVLGHKWSAATPVFRIFAVVALAQCLALLGQRVLAAIYRTRFVFRFSVVESVLSVGAFAVGLQWGIVGVAACYAIVSIPLQVIYVGLTARAVGSTLLSVGRRLTGVTVATALMVVTCLGVQQALVSTHVAAAVRLVLVILTGVLVYAAASWVVNPQAIHELKSLRARRRGTDAVAIAT